MAATYYVYYRSLRSTEFKWTASGSGTGEFYLELAAGGDPVSLVKSAPANVFENNVAMTPGAMGSLAASEWDWGDNDSLGYDTVYVRLADDADPDSKAVDYVESGGDNSDGTTWAKAYQSLMNAAILGAAAGEEIWTASDHKETAASSKTLAFTHSGRTDPPRVLSVNRDTSALEPGAEFETTGSSSDITISGTGMYFNGLTFDCGDDLNVDGSNNLMILENCLLQQADGFTAAGSTGSSYYLDCEIQAKDTGAFAIAANGGSLTIFRNCEFTAPGGATTARFVGSIDDGSRMYFENCDLSDRGANLTTDTVPGGEDNHIMFRRCRLPASYVVLSTAYSDAVMTTTLESCAAGDTLADPPIGNASGDDIAGLERHSYWGTIKSDLSHFRTGGADDGENAHAYSWAMASSANVKELFYPLRSPPIVRWVEPKGSISGATARGLFSNATRCGLLTAPANITADAVSTWNGADVGTKQKLTHTLSNGSTLTLYFASDATMQNDEVWMEVSEPDQVGGPVSVVVCLAKASDTIYVDPKLEVS